ncbi:MAG: hypothetical protein K1X75_13080 [Leptospirales bacterium]|nr:hypothetical protein [Leptospirales bacterium]
MTGSEYVSLIIFLIIVSLVGILLFAPLRRIFRRRREEALADQQMRMRENGLLPPPVYSKTDLQSEAEKIMARPGFYENQLTLSPLYSSDDALDREYPDADKYTIGRNLPDGMKEGWIVEHPYIKQILVRELKRHHRIRDSWDLDA